ncbi:MAG: DUF6600 domain-containing protein [Agriterribacter sp.]
MKKFLLIFTLVVALQSKTEAQFGGNYISFQTFYDQLSPYGIWTYSPEYGYVWAPNAGRYFKPYFTNGRWVYTHYGWTWVSNYRWGWATFHYGRWIYDDWRGWLWMPGYDWAPAWVAWGYYGNNYGWAPLAPGINININFGWRPPSGWWTFVPGNRFGGSNWNRYTIRNNRNITVNNITIINNIYNGNNGPSRVSSPWMRGPEARDVERRTNTRIRPMEITDARDPSSDRVANNKLAIYRPAVDRKAEAKPGRVEEMDKVRPVTKLPERDPGNNLVQPTRPTNPRPVDPSPVTRPVTPSPRPKPTPETRPTNPAPQPQPSPRPVTRPVQPQPNKPAPKPVTRPVQPQPTKPEAKPVTRPAEKSKPTPAPRRAGRE